MESVPRSRSPMSDVFNFIMLKKTYNNITTRVSGIDF